MNPHADDTSLARNAGPTDRSPQQIRDDMEATRHDMGRRLDELEARVTPSQIAERQSRRVRARFVVLRERVMGAEPGPRHAEGHSNEDDGMRQGARDLAASAQDTAQDVGDRVRHAPDEALQRTRGNPFAAGLIALGAGALLGSLTQATEPERAAAQTLRDRYEDDARSEAQRVMQETQGELKDSAKDAAMKVGSVAMDAASTTGDQAVASTRQVRQDAADTGRR